MLNAKNTKSSINILYCRYVVLLTGTVTSSGAGGGVPVRGSE